jgi:hypothetical protein
MTENKTEKSLLNKYYTPQKRWTGKWIWAKGFANEPNSYYFFRKEFNLDSINEGLKIYIAAESKYKLYINGAFVGGGSPMSQPYNKYYDVRDISNYLKKGQNCIGVLAYYVGNVPDVRGGIIAEITDAKDDVVTFTGSDWRTVRAEAWESNTHYFRMNKDYPYQEFFNMNLFPEGWALEGFDDSDWEKSAILFTEGRNWVDPWSCLVPRDIPFMYEYYVLPKKVERVEECLSLENRVREEDLSICLSTPGRSLQFSTIADENNLLAENGVTQICNSTNHMLLSSKIPCFLANKIPYFFSSIFKDLFSVCQPITVICEA